MLVSEGKLGRVFFIRLEDGDDPTASIQRFAVENGVQAGSVFVLGDHSASGIIAPDPNGKPGLNLQVEQGNSLKGCDVVVQELLGFLFQRIKDPASGKEMLAKVRSPKTRVMEKPTPPPDEKGPGTIPIYLFNAEFN